MVARTREKSMLRIIAMGVGPENDCLKCFSRGGRRAGGSGRGDPITGPHLVHGVHTRLHPLVDSLIGTRTVLAGSRGEVKPIGENTVGGVQRGRRGPR